MTRLTLQTRVLSTVGDSSLTTEFIEWLESVLRKIEGFGKWRFLESGVTHQTVNNGASVALSALDTPIADNAGKQFVISSTNAPYNLDVVSIEALRASPAATGDPYIFAFWRDALYFYPIPVTGTLPLLTVGYYKNMTLPTGDSDVLETVVGLRKGWLGYLQTLVENQGFLWLDDDRQDSREEFEVGYIKLMAQEDGGVFNETQPDSRDRRKK